MWYLKKIPKVMHVYWGNEHISYLRYMTLKTFLDLNPDWRVKFYVPANPFRGDHTWTTFHHKIPFTGRDYMKKIPTITNLKYVIMEEANYEINPAIPEVFKSDFLRLNLLSTVGGLWSDMDVLYFKPVDELNINTKENEDTELAICFGNDETVDHYSIGFMMACANNPFFAILKNAARNFLHLKNYQSIGSYLMHKLFPSFDFVKHAFSTAQNVGMKTIYPVGPRHCYKLFQSTEISDFGTIYDYMTEETIGLHWYAGAKNAMHIENKIHEGVLPICKIMLCEAIRIFEKNRIAA